MLQLRFDKFMGEGVYLTGRVGRGKTMLMDLFFKTVETAQKRRVHHGEFMEEIHRRIHALRAGKHGGDAIATVADGIGEDARLLCLDEFQVNDITDAMLLGRLFQAVMERGVFVVFSTNTEPDRLYENGLNRQLFLPFIAFIKQRFTIVELSGGTDYRSQADRRRGGLHHAAWRTGRPAYRSALANSHRPGARPASGAYGQRPSAECPARSAWRGTIPVRRTLRTAARRGRLPGTCPAVSTRSSSRTCRCSMASGGMREGG